MKAVDVKSNTYIDSVKGINNEDPKFEIGDIVRKLNYIKVFAEGYTPDWSKEVFMIKKVKNAVLWKFVTNDLNGQKSVRNFYKK